LGSLLFGGHQSRLFLKTAANLQLIQQTTAFFQKRKALAHTF